MVASGQDNGSSQSSSSETSSTGNAPSSSTSRPPNGSDDPSGSGSPTVPVSAKSMNVAENINGVMSLESHKTKTANRNREGHPSYASTDADGKAPILDAYPSRSTVDPSATWGSSQTAAGRRDATNKPDQLYGGGGPPPASSTSSGSLPPRAAHDSETQHRGGVTGPDQISSSNSPRPSKQSRRERTAHIPRVAGQVHRTPSAQSPLKSSSSVSSPALRRQSFSMSSFSPPLVPPAPTETSKRTRTPRGMPPSDLQVVTGGGVSSHTPVKRGVVLPGEQSNGKPPTAAQDNVSPLSNHTPSRAEPDSEHNPSSQAPPIASGNSRSTRNEETGYNPKGSIEKKNTVEQRRNVTLDERDGSRPGASGYDAHRAQHRQTKPVSRRDRTPHTAPSPNIVQPSVSGREQPHNPIHRINSGSPHAHNANQSRETHKFLPEVPLTESPLTGPTVSSGHPPAPLPSASLSPPNGDHKALSSSDLATPVLTAGQRGTHTNLQPAQSGYHSPPLSHSQPTVSRQPSPQSLPDTTIQHQPQNAESPHTQRRRGWAFIVRCDCIRA